MGGVIATLTEIFQGGLGTAIESPVFGGCDGRMCHGCDDGWQGELC
jgi:hypothetical protein